MVKLSNSSSVDESLSVGLDSCKNCGVKYKKKHKNQKHCTRVCACKWKYSRRNCKRKRTEYKIFCKYCEKEFTTRHPEAKFCSSKCSGNAHRKYFDIPDCLESPERNIDKNIGYVRIYVPMHPKANTRGYVYEHKVIAEQMLGRSLLPNEVVHYKNGVRWDNCKENLEVMDKVKHSRL